MTFLSVVPIGEPEAAQEDRTSELPAYAELLKKIPVKTQQRFDVPTGKPQYRRVPMRDEKGFVVKATQQDGTVVTVFAKNDDGTDKQEATGRGMEEARHASLFEQAGKLDERGVSVRVKHAHMGPGERASDGVFVKDESKPKVTQLTVIVREKRNISVADGINRIVKSTETRQKKTAVKWQETPEENTELRGLLERKGKHYATAIKAGNAALTKLKKNGLSEEQQDALYESVRAAALLPEDLKGI